MMTRSLMESNHQPRGGGWFLTKNRGANHICFLIVFVFLTFSVDLLCFILFFFLFDWFDFFLKEKTGHSA